MDDWDIPEDQDYESRYADELEMLNDLEKEGPPSRKSLNFHDNERVDGQTSLNSDVNTDESKLNGYLAKSKKRDCDEMFASSRDTCVEGIIEIDQSSSDDSAPNKKRARLSPLSNGELHSPPTSILGTTDKNSHETASLSLSPVNINETWNSSLLSDRKRVFSRPPLSCNSVSVTRIDGQRLYLSIKADVEEKRSRKSVIRKGTGYSLHLLSTPFSVLREHVEEERRRRTTAESERVTASLQRLLNHEPDAEDIKAQEPDIGKEKPVVPQHALWVEKYSPRLFTELLSDDAINRTLLKWLKLWDQTVFNKGKEKKVKRKPGSEQNTKQRQTHNRKQGLTDKTDWSDLDATGRPVRKVALLCGPPGLGKTTLAHVIAKHAGYNVVEMNASDDRSQEVFKNTLEASTQMKSVLGYNERPNCLIIDEIDGAPAPAINVLLSIIKQKDPDAAPTKKTKKGKRGPLSRPIICICNDQYAPALRQLRQIAFLVTFPPTVPSRLAGRLLEIAKQESVNTDMTTLTSLCEKADNDIRSCLNTLQFIHKRHGRVWLEHVQSSGIGQKDTHRSLFSIWQEIFQLPKPKRHHVATITSGNNPTGPLNNRELLFMTGLGGNYGNPSNGEYQGISSMSSRFHSVLHSAMSSGQYDKVSQGIFENYLQVKFKDPSFETVVCGTEWFAFSDFIESAVLERQSYILQGYSPFLSVAFHLFYASASHSKLSYPSSQYENYLKETRIKNLVNTVKNESSPRMRKNVDIRTACLDMLPFILEIMTPTLRPVSTQLFSAREKVQLAELIDSMIGYNLTYQQERNFDGQYTYVLDPNIEEAVKFPGLPQHKQLTYATKQLIAREIDLEKMRRAERVLTANSQTVPGGVTKEESKPKKPAVILSLDTSKGKPKDMKPALDFFGRPFKVKPKSKDNQDDQTPQMKPSVIWFRFNEGYSNAVRKSVKVQEFL